MNSSKKDSSRIMGEAKVPRLLVLYSLPVFFSYICNSIDNIVCRAFIGSGSVGPLGIAGISVVFPITMVAMAFSNLLGMGGSTLAASRTGEGNKEAANRVMNQSMQALLIVALIISVGASIFLKQLLTLFGASEAVLPYAMEYARILVIGCFFQIITVGMTNYMRVEGRTGLAMVAVVTGPIVNFILCNVLIRWLDMGLTGAAIATACGHVCNFIIVVTHFARSKGFFHFNKDIFRFDGRLVAQIAYLGLSAFALQICQSLVSVALNRIARQYGGDFAVSGMGVVTTIQQFILTVSTATNMGSQSILAYNYGAKSYSRVREIIRTAICATVVAVAVEYAVLFFFTRPIASIFTSKTPEVIDFSCKALIIYLMMSPLVPIQIQGAGFFQAIKKPIIATLLSLSRQAIVLAPLLVILPKAFNSVEGMFYAGPIADFVSVVITLALLIPCLKKLRAAEDGSELKL